MDTALSAVLEMQLAMPMISPSRPPPLLQLSSTDSPSPELELRELGAPSTSRTSSATGMTRLRGLMRSDALTDLGSCFHFLITG